MRADYFCLTNCPPVIVSQLNLVSGFAGRGEVVSFQAPYLCRNCDFAAVKLLDLRRADHRHVIASLEPPEFSCPNCGEQSDFDDLPELYFQYFRVAPLPNPPPVANMIIDGRDSGQAFRIRKTVADTVTGVWLSGSMHRAPYFKHLADGLQGDVVVVAADVDSVNDEGLAGFIRFLNAPDLTSHLARVPPVLLSSLAEVRDELGDTRLVSVLLPCRCDECHRDVLIEIGPEAVRALGGGESAGEGEGDAADGVGEGDADRTEIELRCPECTHAILLDPPATWLEAALSIPMSKAPDSVASYLADRPDGPEKAQAAQTGKGADTFRGRYKIVKRIASGGMGEVFLARQLGPAGFEKLIVIKRIRADRVEDDEAIDSFLQEARLSARLSHPNIVQIFDLGKVRDEYFLTMEYVEGLDLRTIMSLQKTMGTSTPVGIACRIVSDLCQALQAAHTHRDASGEERPIIHRDISPGNVLISLDGVAKLTDFGIAKAGDSDLQTKSGVIKGTMRYIAPEMLRGPRTKALHPRIDVYGAGVLLYEVLTGSVLFSGESWVHTLRAILRQPLPRLSEQRPGISLALERTFEQAVARNPKLRFQTARDFQDDLNDAMDESGFQVTNRVLADWVRDMMEARTRDDTHRAEPPTMNETADTNVSNRVTSK